jgi:hypothetical protein
MEALVGLALDGVGLLICVTVAMLVGVGAGVLLSVSIGGGSGALAEQADSRHTNTRKTKNLFIL